MSLRPRLALLTDRFLKGVVVALLAGTTLAFGGHVWWAPPALAVLCTLLVFGGLVRMLLSGRFWMLRSPWTALAALALLTAAAQVVTLPPRVSRALSPASYSAYALGFFPERSRDLDPEVDMPSPPESRTPVSLDRPATLRWIGAALACLAVFWGVAHFTDRLNHLYVVWGSVVAGLFVNTAFVVVQLSCRARGLFGLFEPGKGPFWTPDLNDLLSAPGSALLRVAAEPKPGHPAWALVVPDRPYLLGTQMGGPGAYLALASLALPLALALALQLLAPRGSREPLTVRLGRSGHGGLVVLLVTMLVASAAVTGILAGASFSLPFAVAVVAVGLPSCWRTGLRWTALGLTSLVLLSLGLGAAGSELSAASVARPLPLEPERIEAAVAVWEDAIPMLRDFPALGTGLGTFGSVYPYYKTRDGAATTASSSLLQWSVESGAVGVALLVLAALWGLWRLPGAVRRVGSADRALVFGLIGAVLGFTLLSAVHWTVELLSVALAAAAVAGTCNRWLAGGTDLFVERG